MTEKIDPELLTSGAYADIVSAFNSLTYSGFKNGEPNQAAFEHFMSRLYGTIGLDKNIKRSQIEEAIRLRRSGTIDDRTRFLDKMNQSSTPGKGDDIGHTIEPASLQNEDMQNIVIAVPKNTFRSTTFNMKQKYTITGNEPVNPFAQ